MHRVVLDDEGKYCVEFPVPDEHGIIEQWFPVGGEPGLPNPRYDTLGEAIAFICGLENGMQGHEGHPQYGDAHEQKAYDDGLEFGLQQDSAF